MPLQNNVLCCKAYLISSRKPCYGKSFYNMQEIFDVVYFLVFMRSLIDCKLLFKYLKLCFVFVLFLILLIFPFFFFFSRLYMFAVAKRDECQSRISTNYFICIYYFICIQDLFAEYVGLSFYLRYGKPLNSLQSLCVWDWWFSAWEFCCGFDLVTLCPHTQQRGKYLSVQMVPSWMSMLFQQLRCCREAFEGLKQPLWDVD